MTNVKKVKFRTVPRKMDIALMKSNLRNFNLTLDEIKIVKMINELINNLENLEFNDPLSPRAEFFRKEIEKLEVKLEEVRDSTLIKY